MVSKTSDPKKIKTSDNYIGDIYFNGFGVGTSGTDIALTILSSDGKKGRLIMPFGTAKSLGAALTNNIKKIEEKLGHINSIEEAKEKLKGIK